MVQTVALPVTPAARNHKPVFSVVIPTFERPQPLAACLAALAAMTYDRTSFEVLVVDDGGTSPLDSLVAGFQDRLDITFLKQKNAGPATARNHGASRASGSCLVFIDDDCAPATDYLSKLEARIADAPGCTIGGRTINALTGNVFSTASQTLCDYLYHYYNANPDDARFLASNNMAVPAEVFRAVRGFDTTFKLAAFEDRELCDRLRRRGGRIVYAPEAHIYHSHPMTLRRYCRQHYTYGRGAATFHGKHDDQAGAATPEPVRFYANLVRFPFSQRSASNPVVLAALMVVSQVATALGFLRERLAPRRPAHQVTN
jgi:GT2 family glycosyltransferase